MLKPILRPILKSILQPVLSGSTDLTRWVWTLNGMSYGAIPAAELYSDFEIEVKINTTSTLRTAIVDDMDSVTLLLRMESTGYMQLLVGDGTTYSTLAFGTTTVINDGSDHLVKASRVGNLYSLRVDGNLEADTNRSDAVYPSIKYVGSRDGSSYFLNGRMWDLKVAGITNTDVYPSGTFNYKLDEPYSESHIAVDSDNGVIMNKFNDLSEDYSEVSL